MPVVVHIRGGSGPNSFVDLESPEKLPDHSFAFVLELEVAVREKHTELAASFSIEVLPVLRVSIVKEAVSKVLLVWHNQAVGRQLDPVGHLELCLRSPFGKLADVVDWEALSVPLFDPVVNVFSVVRGARVGVLSFPSH